MKRLFLILLIFMSLTSFSQIRVKEGSFRKLDGFVMLDKYEHTDINNAPMALIKISTEGIDAEQRRKFTFKGNAATGFECYFEPGEIHLYISAEPATYIEIIHDDYGKTEYTLPYDLCKWCGYEMVVQYVPTVPSQPSATVQQNNYLSVTADQESASIYIDDDYVGEKEGFRSFAIGTTHSWRIECDLYHTESGTVTITEGEPITIEKQLRPAYGYLDITSSPENGAMVFLNNKKVGNTPYRSEKLATGSYAVKVVKDMFKAVETTCVVADGKITETNIKMESNFVNVTIHTDSKSDIFVDEKYKGKGKWTGRLSEGAHFVEVKKDNHRTVTKNMMLVLGKDENVTIEAPTPIIGTIDISSKPMKADIYLNGKHYGQTPKIINDLLIGDYQLELKKDGYAVMSKAIRLEENQTLKLYEELSMGKKVDIRSDRKGDEVYVDGRFVGKSPFSTNLTYGNHMIEVKRGNSYGAKTIEVGEYSESVCYIYPEKEPLDKYLADGVNYITAQAAYSSAPQWSFGMSFGTVDKIGWFVSAMSNFDFVAFEKEKRTEQSVSLTGESRTTRLSLTAGMLVRVGGMVYYKLGIGAGFRLRCLEADNGGWYEHLNNSYKGVDLETGLQFHLRHITFDVDVVTTNFKTTEVKLGFGFNWKKRH